MKRILLASAMALALGVATYLLVPRLASPARSPAPAAATTAPPPMSEAARREFERWYEAQPRFALPVSNDGAVVLIVKFTDYQCPGCAWSHNVDAPVLAKWEARLPGAIKLVSKQYPLNTDCNKVVVRTIHPVACDAAVAALLADEQRRSAEMENWLYANQEQLTPDAVRRAAASIGEVANFDGGREKALQTIATDTQIGRMLGVSSTPTFFVNGVKMARTDKVMPAEELDAAITYELRKAGKIK